MWGGGAEELNHGSRAQMGGALVIPWVLRPLHAIFVRWPPFLEPNGQIGLSLAMPQLGFEKRARLGHLGRKTRLPGAPFMEHLPIEGPGI